jgi:hypothetical protein
MNKIIASVGVVALGAANVQAQSSSSPMSEPPAKWWNVQATVRGFYDDNVSTTPSHQSASVAFPIPKIHAWGYQLSPKVGVTLGNDQTTFAADYQYSFLYYDHKPFGNTQKYDQDHTFNLALTHAFTERYSVRVRDAFIVGQEPDALRYASADAAIHTPYRVSGNNMVNSGGIAFEAELTPQLGMELAYDNNWYDYSDRFNAIRNVDPITGAIVPSVSGILDRIEQIPHVSALWHVMPETTVSLSYQFEQINYTANEPIQGFSPGGVTATSSDRDMRSHSVYLGVDHQFRPDFYGSVQAGASYYDYYNLNTTSFGPYARLSLTYVYMEESSIQAGFQEGREATDVIGANASLVRDTESSVAFANVRQRIVPHLFANLNGTAQRATFDGGGPGLNGKVENFLEFGANLEYQFNPHFSAQAGYDFDRLDSDLGDRSYSRNKVYIGATASY